MTIFSRPRTSQAVDRLARLQTMIDMPFGGEGLGGEFRNALSQVVPGIMTTYGLGTTIREGMTPAGNTVPDATPSIIPNPAEALGRLAQNIGGMIRGDEQQPSMTEDEYKSSPYFRTDIPFEQGMTQDRAAALALFYDQRKVAEYFGSKRPVSTFLGQFVGQAFDPINYVPVFGQTAEAAAVARLGTIAGRAVVGAADGAVNTAIFGALTTRMREEFGDDTSWQAMTSEIAMSALVGGAFGGLSPIVRSAWQSVAGRADRAAEARAANLLTDLRTVKESRAMLNEAVGDLAAGRDVTVTPNAAATIDRIAGTVTSEAASVRALREQTANVTGDNVAITPSGQRVNVQPEVVDASTLVRATGDLQVRNRSSFASAQQVEEMATNLDPVRLMPSINADSGAPIVGSDNVIDSGNGRVMAINRAYDAYPERAAAYRKALEDAGYVIPEGVQRPVLINRRLTDLSPEARAKFNAEANAPRAAQMSAVELAAMDRNALDGALDVLDAAPVTAASNRAFVERFLGNLTPSARGALIDANGAINADGVRRIENALVALAYGDVDAGVLRRFAEATDDNTRAIVGAMSDAAGKWAQMRREVKLGNISPEFDATTELTQALRLIGQWREQAANERRPVSTVIKEGMGQLDLLDGQISPEAQVIISAFYKTNAFTQAAGRDTIAEFLSRVVDSTMELGRPQLFDTPDVGKMEVLRSAASNEQGNLFTPIGADDGIEADGGFSRRLEVAADRQDSGQGARADVGQRISERFAAAGRPKQEADALGEIVDAFYSQQAARLGLTMDEMVERFGLPEVRQGGDMPEAAMAQSPDSPAFREWFGDSKVVDENGEPLVVYRGSKTIGAQSFDPNRRTEKTQGTGVWFSNDRGAAQSYAGADGELYPVYLSLQNPVVVDWNGHWTDGPELAEYRVIDSSGVWHGRASFDTEAQGEAFARSEGLQDFTVEAEYGSEGRTTDEFVRRIRERNPDADGIILRNVSGGGEAAGGFADFVSGDEYVAFSPTQIKSVANRGTFDPNDPRILFQKNRAAITLGGTNIITLFETADASSALHETGHLFLSILKGMGEAADAPTSIRADWESVRDWWRQNAEAVAADANASGRAEGVTAQNVIDALDIGTTGDGVKDRAIDVGMQEQWARGFEAYVREGRAPSSGLARAFEQFREWLTSIYRRAADLNVNLSPEIRQVFDNLLGAQNDRAIPSIDGSPVRLGAPPTEGRASSQVAAVQASLLDNAPDNAAARVGRDDTIRDIALSHGVDPTTGAFLEQGDIDQIRQEGRLTLDDEADLAAADQMFADAEAYGRALEAAMRCVI